LILSIKILGIEVGAALIFDLVFGGGFLCVLCAAIVHLTIEKLISNGMEKIKKVFRVIKGGVLSERT